MYLAPGISRGSGARHERLGAGREAGQHCALATIVMVRISMYGLRDSTAALLLLLLS